MRDITSKKSVLSLAIAAALLAMISSGRTWVSGSLNDGVVSSRNVPVTGSQAVPGYFGIALVAVAGLLAAATAGRIVRWPAAVLSLLASLAMIGLTLKVMFNPGAAVKSRMTSIAGHNGEAVVHGSFAVWFWVAVFAGLLSLMCSVLGFIGLRRWAGLSSRYEAPSEEPRRAESDWDLMSRGVDPTERAAGGASIEYDEAADDGAAVTPAKDFGASATDMREEAGGSELGDNSVPGSHRVTDA